MHSVVAQDWHDWKAAGPGFSTAAGGVVPAVVGVVVVEGGGRDAVGAVVAVASVVRKWC